MKKQSNTPHIRFQNYEDEWDVEKLKNIFGTIRNAFVGTATPYYVENGNFYLESNNVKNGKINYNSQIFINDEFYEKQRDKWLKTNDIVMVQSGHVGHTAVIPEELNNTAAHALIVFTDYKKEVNPHFLNYQFQSNDKRKGLDLISTGNTIKHILASEMKNFKMDFPTSEEQSAIGSLFRTINDLLASYKDNLINYQSLKATMLSKMFPKAGQTVPEIRLEGFEGKWEKYHLGDIFEQISNYIEPSVENELWSLTVEKGLTPKTERYKRDFLVKKNDKFKKVDLNEFVYNPMNLTLGALDLNNNDVTISVSGYYVVMKNIDVEKFNNDFLKILLKTTYAIYQYKQFATGTLIEKQRVQFPTFSEIPFYLPTIAEQQAIGSYFSNLDNLINSQQEKISQLETLKKKLLQDMFI